MKNHPKQTLKLLSLFEKYCYIYLSSQMPAVNGQPNAQFLLSIIVVFIHNLPLHTLYIYYDVLYIYVFINGIPKDLSLHKVYLLC